MLTLSLEVLQCLSKWQNGFGSTALAKVMNFISNLDSNDLYVIAKYLQLDYHFLRDDFESMEAEGMCHLPFLLELIVTTHLNNLAACIEVPGWNTSAMVAGQDGEQVVALAAAVLEHAISLIAEGHLELEPDILSSTDRKSKVKLPRVINKQTGQVTTTPFQFLSANWSGDTAAYRGLVCRRGPDFVQAIFSEAHALKSVKAEPASGAPAGGTGTVNPCFALCKTSPSNHDFSSDLMYFICF
ncbi:hypothetical protein J3R82DRAFT_106 [Butyriboletus roseoflavus]|nr:hypothetical protein J3R82DRAFT_106 [Butyriboletus roseoflavus]